MVWAARAGNISLAGLGLTAANLAEPGWLLGWGSHMAGLELELAGWLSDGIG